MAEKLFEFFACGGRVDRRKSRNLHATLPLNPTPLTSRKITHEPVHSSSVASAGYDPQRQVLEVRYHGSGKTYAYAGVPYDVHLKFLTAKSKGAFVHHVVEKQFKAVQVR